MNDLTNFDPVAVGNQIAALETKARRGESVWVGRSEQIAAILWDVQQNHPEHLDTVCGIAKIGESRRYELLQVGGGRKAIEQQRAENAARQKRLQDKRKAAVAAQKKKDVAPPLVTEKPPKQLAAPEAPTVPVTTPQVKASNNGKSTDKPKKDAKAKPEKAPAPIKSSTALEEIKQFCKHWVPLLNKSDRRKAADFLGEIFADAEAGLDEHGRKRYGSRRKQAAA